MATIDSSDMELVFAQRLGSSKSPMAITGRADVLKMPQNGNIYHGGNATTLRVVTP